MNSDIKKFIEHYCGLSESHAPGYAIMVSGDWGSGKTHLVKQVLRQGKEDEIPNLYVSLYGMSSVAEIGEALFQQLHPVLSSKGMRVATKLGKGFLRGAFKFDLDGDGKADGSVSPDLSVLSLTKNLKTAGERVLVFDDLERSKISVDVVLGYINSFVEHEGCKAILIANENEILDEQKAAYLRIREKLIGKTFNVEADFASALGHFIGLIDDDTLRDRYEEKRKLIAELFELSETNNLRILKNTLWDFERFVRSLSDAQQSHDRLIEALLRLFLVLSFELRSGRLSETQLLHFDKQFGTNVKSGSEEPETGPTIEERYPSEIFDDSVLAFPTWARILVDGALDSEEIQKELDEHPLFIDAPEPSWRVLWQPNGTEAEIDRAIKDVEGKFLGRKYTETCEIFHVLGIRLWLARIGALDGKTPVDIVSETKVYIDDLLSQERLLTDEIYGDSISWAGLSFREQELDEFRSIRKHLKKSQYRALEVAREKEANSLLAMIETDSKQFYTLLKNANHFGIVLDQIPILHFLNSTEFTSKVLTLSRVNLKWVLLTFYTRYNNPTQAKQLKPELPWLAKVDEILRKSAEKLGPVQKDTLLVFVNDYLKPTLAKYKSITSSDAEVE